MFWNFFPFLLNFFGLFGPKICPNGFVGDNCEIECGLTFVQQNQRIVGGVVAAPNSWPAALYLTYKYSGYAWVSSLKRFVYVNEESDDSFCGGTLIDKTTVLTAAHCVLDSVEFEHNNETYTINIRANDWNMKYYVNLGAHSKSDNNSVKYQVRKVIMHQDYDDDSLVNDIALFKLSKPAVLNERVQVACLPLNQSSTYPPSNISSWAVGWGTIGSDMEQSETLKNVKLNVYDYKICNDRLSSNNPDTQVCSGDLAGGKDTCQGDSGGGLWVTDVIAGKSKYVLSGITSYGKGCGNNDSAGIYTRVSAYLDWIRKNK